MRVLKLVTAMLTLGAVSVARASNSNNCIPQIWNASQYGSWGAQYGALAGYNFGDFNVISFGDFASDDGGDVEGRLLVAGDVTIDKGFTVGLQLQQGTVDAVRPYSVVVGGKICWADGSVFPDGSDRFQKQREDIFAGEVQVSSDGNDGKCRFPNYLASRVVANCPSGSPNCLDAGLAHAQSYFVDLVNNWDQVSQKSPSEDNRVGRWEQLYWHQGTGGLKFTATSKNTAEVIFRVPNSIWNGATYSQLSNVDVALQNVIVVIVNDDNKPTVFSQSDFPAAMERTAFVFPTGGEQPAVQVSGGMQGSIVAPTRTYHQSHGITERGMVIAGDISQFHQANKPLCPLTPFCSCCDICEQQQSPLEHFNKLASKFRPHHLFGQKSRPNKAF